MGKYNYIDKAYFGKCLREAVLEKYNSMSEFAFYKFKDKTSRAVAEWAAGEHMPDPESLTKLSDIFGRERVISWFKYTF